MIISADLPSQPFTEFRLKPLSLRDKAIVDALLDQLTSYSMAVDGVPKMADGAKLLLSSRPVTCTPCQKHTQAVMVGVIPVGLVDVIAGYPMAGTAFVGLLAIAECRQGEGMGRRAFRLLECFARESLGASKLRLGVVASNSVGGFWRRMGFIDTGERRLHWGEALECTTILMEKNLTSASPPRVAISHDYRY